MNGPSKGATHNLAQNLLVIGRSAECDIIVNDPKCSRKHAKVEWTEYGYEVQVLSDNNSLKVNGSGVEQALLADGDVVCLGDTEIQFNLIQFQAPAISQHLNQPAAAPAWSVQPVPAHTVIGYQDQRPAKKKKSKPKANNTRRFLIYGIVLLFFAWILLDSGNKKKKDIQIRTQDQVDQDIDAAKKMQAATELARKNNLSPTLEMRQAQENYVKGFRDFKKGQYERALESFQACLALYPDHILCNRYQRLSQRKFNELIEYHMVLGRSYRDQEQYQACRSAFRNVMVMVKDFSSPIYKEAKANFDTCNSYVEGRF